MVDLRKRVESPAMCIDTTTTSTNGRRPVFPSLKFRLREERKRVIRITKAKYNNIDDHEIGMRRFCLIRNTLQCLQREAREEKLARHNARVNNVSPSYLSASRPRSPSPPCDMEVADVLSHYGQPSPLPIAALSDDEDDMPPCKRPRLSLDDDKENEKENSCEDRLLDVVGDKDEPRAIDDAQEILREVYESYTGESLSQSQSSPLHTRPETPYNSLCCNTNNLCTNATFLLDSSSPTNVSGCMEWSKHQQQYPCSHSALMGNDLQSVVYQSLITSL